MASVSPYMSRKKSEAVSAVVRFWSQEVVLFNGVMHVSLWLRSCYGASLGRMH